MFFIMQSEEIINLIMYGKKKDIDYKKETKRIFWSSVINFFVILGLGYLLVYNSDNYENQKGEYNQQLQSVFNNCNVNEGYVSNIVINKKNTTFECWDLSRCINITRRGNIKDYGIYDVEKCTLTVKNMYGEEINGRWVVQV